MKLNVQITQKGTGLKNNETIIEIDICNGNWKYIDDYMETTEKTTLTINNINQSHYLSQPVKDTFPMHDMELYEETGEIKLESADVRTYDSLLEYLNYRIDNVKEETKKGLYNLVYAEKGGMSWHITLFRERRRAPNDVCADVVYKKECMCEVKISVVE